MTPKPAKVLLHARLLWLAAALLAWPAGCKRQAPAGEGETMTPAKSWYVLKGGRKVLQMKDEPGPIVSRALLPPGAKPATHPFLTASALDPMEEDRLQTLLEKSRSFQEFVDLLKKDGYTLEPAP